MILKHRTLQYNNLLLRVHSESKVLQSVHQHSIKIRELLLEKRLTGYGFFVFPCSVRIPGMISYKMLSKPNNSSLGMCSRANFLWHVYRGSVTRRTACPYPGITLPLFKTSQINLVKFSFVGFSPFKSAFNCLINLKTS